MAIKDIKQKYSLNKKSKVGEKLICPSCGNSFIKSQHQQAFCKTKKGTKCKDYYWNNVTPNKRNNITRISPASKAWLSKQKLKNFDPHDYEHPFSSEGLGQW